MQPYEDAKLYEYLKELSVIDEDTLTSTFEQSKRDKIPFETLLLKKDLISDVNLGKTISEIINVPFVKLAETEMDKDVLQIIPEVVAKKQRIIAFKKDKTGTHLAMENPKNTQIIEFLEHKTGESIVVYYATHQDMDGALILYAKDAEKAFDEIIKESVDTTKGEETEEDPSIIKIVDTILRYASQNKASDVHIEPLEEVSLVRFRIDGILHDIVRLPMGLHEQVVTRIKVLSNLRTDEHQAAQDGKMEFSTETEEIDLRVSIVPITAGEKIVLRLLSEKSRKFSLADLGLEGNDFELIRNGYKKPHGMILVTGPTGSGKTTSLYSILKVLNKREINIMTIEDPVEYDVEGINQIQVNEKTNLTFAAGLKSIVRQDPDVILVGEIRDDETAGISINSAMTGHLVLSTMHTNDAATALPRLIDMGIEPYLVASTVNIIVGQRLVRKICNHCKHSQDLKISESQEQIPVDLQKRLFGDKQEIRVYQGKGCPVCHHTGYGGRIGIFEILEVTPAVREAITTKKNSNEIFGIAQKEGMTSMMDDGLNKVLRGVTTIEEIVRVTKIV